MKDLTDLSLALEAILFAAGTPMDVAALRRVLRRANCDLSAVAHTDLGPSEAATAPQQTASQSGEVQAAEEAAHPEQASEAEPQDAGACAGGDVPDQFGGTSSLSPDGPSEVHQGDGLIDAFAEAVGAMASPAAMTTPRADPAPYPGDLTLTAPQQPKAKTASDAIRRALEMTHRRWRSQEAACGFTLVEVAGGFTFRTRTDFAAVVAGLKEERPARLSRPAMESLAIVAYRQPVTKPEVDALRGVDCGGTLKVLLDRRLIAVVGKKEEPGRPLLYGTTDAFMSLFNLPCLSALPSLREFNELNADSEEALRAFDGLPSLAELSAGQKQFRMDEAPSLDALDAAVSRLKDTEGNTRSMLLAHGVTLQDADGDPPASAPKAAGVAQAEPNTLH